MAFWKREKRLSCEDLTYLSKLLQTDLPLSHCLFLLETRENENLVIPLRERLKRGEEVSGAFETLIPEELSDYFIPLLKVLPFKDALELSLQFRRSHEENRKEIFRSIAYPCFLLFFSLSCLYIFDLYGLDTIFSLMDVFHGSVSSLRVFRKVFRIVIRVIYVLVLFSLAAFLFFSRRRRVVFFYVLLSKYFPDSLLHTYYSEEFISLFAKTVRMGYKTKESIDILKTLKKKPVISFLAYHLDEGMMEGKSLREASTQAYFDSSLSRFIRIASYTGEFAEILEHYSALSKEKIRHKAKALTSIIQVSSYAFIGILIIFIYQVLFLPLQAIGQF